MNIVPNKSIKGWIIAISIIAGILVLIAAIVFYSNGYCIAMKKKLDTDITISFFTIISAILVPAVAIISALLYYGALLEQRKQNINLSLQHFESQFNEQLKQQCILRDKLYIIHPVLSNGVHINRRFEGIDAFRQVWLSYRLLLKAIKSGNNYSNWELLQSDYENAFANVDPDGILQHYSPDELDKQLDELGQKHMESFIGNIFKIDGAQSYSNVEFEAFALIYNKFLKTSSLYFSHLCSVLRFVERNFAIYSIDAKQQKEYLQQIIDNLSSVEICIIERYANYDLYNKDLIKRNLFANVHQ